MKNILEIKNVCKNVEIGKNNELSILKNINLTIKDGEFISVMGPSGSGKSTLLYNISGMDKVTSGEVLFYGETLSDKTEEEMSKFRLDKMGFIFQDINLLKNLCIIDNIIFPAYVSKKADKEKIKNNAFKLMKKVGIEKLADNDITQASGGQLQRVGICRALINKPNIIFGDEPTGALNSSSTNEIMQILVDINKKGTTIMLVTHDAKVAAKTEKVVYMLDGTIVAEKYLGKYDSSKNIKKREEELMQWLVENGF